MLTAVLEKGTIPHALLFTGPNGVGKQSAAMAFAMALNCSEGLGYSKRVSNISPSTSALNTNLPPGINACGICKACRNISSNTHPDYIQIKPKGPNIRIHQIRELLQTLAMRPYEAEFRVVVISEAHFMNPESSNALLKVLEEPPPRTVLILTATGKAELLPTVVSRCRHVRFNPLPMDTLVRLLIEDHNIEKEQAAALAGLSDGGVDRALQLYRDGWLEKRDWILAEEREFLGHFKEESSLASLFALANELALKTETALTALHILKTLYRDILVCRYQPGQLIHSDIAEVILKAAETSSDGELLCKITAIDRAQKDIQDNANSRLTLEALFLTLAKNTEMN